MELLGRRAECEALDNALADALAGQSRVLVLRGEPGAGKSALLAYLSERATDWHIATAVGIESEMELAYSGLHQICTSMLDQLDRLPAPQRAALATIFGLEAGPAPDRFLVGLATLTLLAEAAEQQPLACIIDDSQWLDAASAQILGFVARRLLAERVALVFGGRSGAADAALSGLPQLTVGGLTETDSRTLLLENIPGPMDARVCEQIIAESHGNPLALLELPRAWNVVELAGGYGMPATKPVASKIEESYTRRLRLLPTETQLIVIAAAAETLGDPGVLQRAVETLEIHKAAAIPATDAGLLSLGVRVQFAHPLIRSAAYRSADGDTRRRVHNALAMATDAERDPDRRAWHLAQAAAGPDETIAQELERAANRAQDRGGIAAGSAFLQRAAELTTDPAARARRALAAAEASVQAAAFERASVMLDTAEAEPLDKLEHARIHLLRGTLAATSSYGSAATELLKAANELVALDPDLAQETYLEAWGTALAAGELADAGTLHDVAKAAQRAHLAGESSSSGLLLDGLSALVIDGLEAAAPTLRKAILAFREGEAVLRWGTLADEAAFALWDIDALEAIASRSVRCARDTGALGRLALALQGAGMAATWQGDFQRAASLTAEAEAVTGATGIRISPYGAMLLAVFRGHEEDAMARVKPAIERAAARGEGLGVQYARWAGAILFNGLGRYEDARVSAQLASGVTPPLFVAHWAFVELAEAAVRTGDVELAENAAARLVDATRGCDTDWGLGIAARTCALVNDDEAADARYAEAIERLGRTPLRPELGRAHLLYGEWLRRKQRRIDARDQLRLALEVFDEIGMDAFSERTRRELLATGERARKRSADTRGDLTAQETQIAQLARDGHTNPEIAAQLFLSPRTIEWHLRKVFTKLEVGSRKELEAALPRTPERRRI